MGGELVLAQLVMGGRFVKGQLVMAGRWRGAIDKSLVGRATIPVQSLVDEKQNRECELTLPPTGALVAKGVEMEIFDRVRMAARRAVNKSGITVFTERFYEGIQPKNFSTTDNINRAAFIREGGW